MDKKRILDQISFPKEDFDEEKSTDAQPVAKRTRRALRQLREDDPEHVAVPVRPVVRPGIESLPDRLMNKILRENFPEAHSVILKNVCKRWRRCCNTIWPSAVKFHWPLVSLIYRGVVSTPETYTWAVDHIRTFVGSSTQNITEEAALVVNAVVQKGYKRLLEYIITKRSAQWDHTAYEFAFGGRHFSIAKWLYTHGCPWMPYLCEFALFFCDYDTFQWFRTHGAYSEETKTTLLGMKVCMGDLIAKLDRSQTPRQDFLHYQTLAFQPKNLNKCRRKHIPGLFGARFSRWIYVGQDDRSLVEDTQNTTALRKRINKFKDDEIIVETLETNYTCHSDLREMSFKAWDSLWNKIWEDVKSTYFDGWDRLPLYLTDRQKRQIGETTFVFAVEDFATLCRTKCGDSAIAASLFLEFYLWIVKKKGRAPTPSDTWLFMDHGLIEAVYWSMQTFKTELSPCPFQKLIDLLKERSWQWRDSTHMSEVFTAASSITFDHWVAVVVRCCWAQYNTFSILSLLRENFVFHDHLIKTYACSKKYRSAVCLIHKNKKTEGGIAAIDFV